MKKMMMTRKKSYKKKTSTPTSLLRIKKVLVMPMMSRMMTKTVDQVMPMTSKKRKMRKKTKTRKKSKNHTATLVDMTMTDIL